MGKLLVTGGSGFLGAHLTLHSCQKHDVVATFFKNKIAIPGADWRSIDLSDPAATNDFIFDIKPDSIINCAAETNVDRCEGNHELAYKLNRDAAANVAMAAKDVGAKLIHISTDAVFDGNKGDYSEEDSPAPINVYGMSKLEGECAVLEIYPAALILRTNFVGLAIKQKKGLAAWFLENLLAERTCGGFSDVLFSPVLVDELADLLLDLVSSKAHGVFHAGGIDCLSKLDFGRKLARCFGLNPDLIIPTSVADARLPALRPRKICLNSNKLRDLENWRPSGVDDALKALRQQYEAGA